MTVPMAICDDDRDFALVMANYIKTDFQNSGISISTDLFTDSRLLIRSIRSEEADYRVLFLDIDMPGIDGIELAKEVKKLDHPPYFIFISGVETLVFQSFTVNPFWFVRKRCWEKELPEALDSLKKELQQKGPQMISIELHQGICTFDVSRLRYVECTNKTLHLHFTRPEKNQDIAYKLSDLEVLLAPYGFIRVHKGYLVNYQNIFKINRSGVYLDDGEVIPVSKYRLQEIKQLYGSMI